jgi:ABC-type Fe2+-enterobactin transport system substrate-binding protein
MNDSILRARLIRLAHTRPEFRSALLPLLRGRTATSSAERQAKLFATALSLLLRFDEKDWKRLGEPLDNVVGVARTTATHVAPEDRGVFLAALRSELKRLVKPLL